MLEIMLGLGAQKRVYPNSGPGPIAAIGDENIGYFGEVTNSELFTAAQLKAAIPELATTQTISNALDNGPWLKFYYYGRFLFIKKTPLLTSAVNNGPTCWNQLYLAGLIHGVDGPGATTSGYPVNQIRLVVKGQWKFKVETITGDDTELLNAASSSAFYDNQIYRKSMFTELLYRMCSFVYPAYTGKKFKNYSAATLTASSYELTRELFFNTTYPTGITVIRAVGGGNDLSFVATSGNRTTPFQWRPVLELIDPAQLFIVRPRRLSVKGGLVPIPQPDVTYVQDAALLQNFKYLTDTPFPITVTSVSQS